MRGNIVIVIALLFSFMPDYGFCQLQSLGLKKKVVTPPNDIIFSAFWPKCQIINNHVYVSTNTGIYRKDLTVTTDTVWDLFALEGIPVTEFVKNGNKLLAITPKTHGELLLLSTDNGKSFVNHTSNHFFASVGYNYLYRIAQNKQNPNSILILHAYSGVSKSEDFGKTWKNMDTFTGGGQDRYISFHPADSMNIYYSGETDFFASYVRSSFNGGLTWTNSELSGEDNCTHHIAFHPSNPDILVSGGEGRITKSTDRGLTWNPAVFLDIGLYVFKVIFDYNNPNTVYATGATRNNNLVIYRSTDAGDSWHVFYMKDMETDYGGILDMEKYQNKLILYTFNEGIYALDLDNLTSTEEIPAKPDMLIYPNPAKTEIEIRLDQNIAVRTLEILDIFGRIISSQRIDNGTATVIQFQLSDLNIHEEGIYFVRITGQTGTYTQKLLVKY